MGQLFNNYGFEIRKLVSKVVNQVVGDKLTIRDQILLHVCSFVGSSS
jgi:hypothetical protein